MQRVLRDQLRVNSCTVIEYVTVPKVYPKQLELDNEIPGRRGLVKVEPCTKLSGKMVTARSVNYEGNPTLGVRLLKQFINVFDR